MALNFPALDSLISQFEGFGTPSAPSITSGNNPGAIQAGPWAAAHGATGAAPNGAAVFPDLMTGTAALDSLVTSKIGAGINTPAKLAESWSPATGAGNSASITSDYAAFLAHGLGIGTGDTIPQATAQASGQDGSWIPATGTSSLWDWIGWDPLTALPPYAAAKQSVGGAVGTATAAVSWWAGLSLAQIVILLLGLILLIAGLFSLRPVQGATATVIRTARRGAALFA